MGHTSGVLKILPRVGLFSPSTRMSRRQRLCRTPVFFWPLLAVQGETLWRELSQRNMDVTSDDDEEGDKIWRRQRNSYRLQVIDTNKPRFSCGWEQEQKPHSLSAKPQTHGLRPVIWNTTKEIKYWKWYNFITSSLKEFSLLLVGCVNQISTWVSLYKQPSPGRPEKQELSHLRWEGLDVFVNLFPWGSCRK